MAVWHQFLLLFHVLYCFATIHCIVFDLNDGEICSVVCKECNASAVFAKNQCECNFNDDDNEDVECIQRLKRDIQSINLNTLSRINDLTGEERSVRSALKSKHRLTIEDAKKVAQYFINGGALADHSHYIGASNVIRDNTNSAVNSRSDIVNESSEATPMISDPRISTAKTQFPVLGMATSILSPVVNRLYPSNPLLSPTEHPYRYEYKSLPHILLKPTTLPSHITHNLAAHRYFPYYPRMYYSPIEKNPWQGATSTSPLVGQPHENNNDFNRQASDNSSTTVNNAGEPVKGNAANIPEAGANTWYRSMQHRHLVSPYQYIPYQSPLINMLYFPFVEYVAQAVPHDLPRTLGSTLSPEQSPNSHCTNNSNIEQRNEVLTIVTDKTTNSNDDKTARTDYTTINHADISKEENDM